ncbi:MAG: DUF2309 domain-containing protein [Gemmataceae bacterium]
MLETPEPAARSRSGAAPDARDIDCLRRVIDHAAHLLPAQGPIGVFIHHNTLHAFEDLPFAEAVAKGASVFRCQPYLSKDQYRAELARGRIRFSDLSAVLADDLGGRASEMIAGLVTRFDLRLAMLQYPLRSGPTEELVWFMAETDALRRVRPEASAPVRGRLIAETRRWALRELRGGSRRPTALAELFDANGGDDESWSDNEWEAFALRALWHVCRSGVMHAPPSAPPAPAIRQRDLLLQVTGADADLPVNDLLIRFCGAFLDQGIAHWQLPGRDSGFYRAFCALYRRPAVTPAHWLRGVADELDRLETTSTPPLESIRESLEQLGISVAEWEEYLSATLLVLRGWAGMIRFLEARGDRAAHPVPPGSLVEFLAIRLILDRFALTNAARDTLGYTGPLARLRDELLRRLPATEPFSIEQRAFPVFRIAQILGWTPEQLHSRSDAEWTSLVAEIEAFGSIERRRVFHLAYERRFIVRALDAIQLHGRLPETVSSTPRLQVVCCLDEREESFRRHLEEVAPDVKTFGAAGFFNVAMYYRGAADAHYVPLCPIVVQPAHWVTERVDDHHSETHERRARYRRALATATHRFHVGSRTFAIGAIVSAGVGVLASVPLVARVLFPRRTARLRRVFGDAVRTPPATHLVLERAPAAVAGPVGDGIGFSLDEMATVAERFLRDIGLTHHFARVVIVLGHGSSSLNNPHKSAYDCGACGGSPGAPNGRAMAQMLSDPRIRQRLAARGLTVPADTVFVGGIHNTANDVVQLFDLDRVPASHQADVDTALRNLERACERNAHERSRRFASAPLTISPDEAKQHVEGRSEDLAQTRPELGHATNALCIVARRSRTRGLFLDRRAFLTTYDPTQDDIDATILTRLLAAAVPVCAGINLEYYFSRVDPDGWGCGTKLPHNVSALLGVMDGAASDLRTGLPWQMVEIHEPIRLLLIVEAKPATLLGILDRNPGIAQLVRNEWIRLAALDPDSPTIHTFRDGEFHPYTPEAEVLPQAASSVDWYRGWRDHLEFARIGE